VELTPGSLNIPFDGSVVRMGLVLPAGTLYTLVSAGSVGITDPKNSGGVTFQCDAEYEWNPLTNQPVLPSDHGVDLGVNATTDDGGGFTDVAWGAFSANHRYQATLISDGNPLDFKLFDSFYVTPTTAPEASPSTFSRRFRS
jgi:hypothetical protein